MNVLIVSTWRTACGIAEHTDMLIDSVHAADPSIYTQVSPALLDPSATWPVWGSGGTVPDVLHLNYHNALHSRWQPETIRRAKALGCKVLLTLHDSGTPNTDQSRALCEAVDYFVVHEPYDDLPANGEYLRMGVPDWQLPVTFNQSSRRSPYGFPEWDDAWSGGRPVLGTVGFPFPWKNYDELAKITAQCGWALLLIAPTATAEQIGQWQHLNPWTCTITSFVPRDDVQRLLGACDATAFTYVCHNTGQSGAILQGIAARKPVIALATCRMFRSLHLDRLGNEAVTWCQTFEDVAVALRWRVPIARVDPGIVALAEQESWTKVGKRYAAIYREMAR